MERDELFELFVGGQTSPKEIALQDFDSLVQNVVELRESGDVAGSQRITSHWIVEQLMIHAWLDYLYLKTTSFWTVLNVFPGGTKDGLDYGPNVIEIVVLDTDGDTLAFRLLTDAQNDDWALGDIEDAVGAAAEHWCVNRL